ncbi:SDR family oxidoreductase [Gramella sp. AN32]|uniref:SDR family oxidoreductase n=1 Tax=Christiangramia antarctica TaxID=2058158 RepID=A0ABW5X842_9FLAO|nr:SDR family oxidoreductase [Gramella sp. AN32]MCM4154538.1 short-chain dehydrogenase/reductase [Gramella sp. AN32]
MAQGKSSKKVVFITGASSGIGKSIANYLAEKGFMVYGTSRNPKPDTSLHFSLIPLDVTEENTIKSAISSIVEKEGQIDVLINNAGVGITGPIEETPEDEIKKAFETNYFGPLNMIKHVLPVMRNQNVGLIINITSIAGYMGLPYRGIYSATKGALAITTEAYRMELKQFNIKMTNIAPGDFATNIAAGRYHAPLLNSSPYKKDYGKTLEIMNEHVDAGKDPDIMAKAVYEVIQTEEPAVHYKVGEWLQKFSVRLKGILPDKMYEKMLLKHYKL